MFDNYSKEEQLLWERKKCASWGITSYDLEPVSGRIIFPAGGSLFFCADPASGFTGPLFPYEIQVRSGTVQFSDPDLTKRFHFRLKPPERDLMLRCALTTRT